MKWELMFWLACMALAGVTAFVFWMIFSAWGEFLRMEREVKGKQ